ncbi:Mbov_0395 family pilin-like conjugal transfer protein [Spiroplasma sp. DGKH1]|uniref:Mbov_0395 family pilin-like conjugal transfer protein n=1 Tax=Spiroplasma sp. DGKH1 TaxID=3050074 RepID=UPI0034C5BF87
MQHIFNFIADTGPDLSGVTETMKVWVNIILGVLFGLLGLFCSVKVVIIAYHIVKSSDNPEERSTYVKSLIWPIVGIIAAVLVPTIVSIVLTAVGTPTVGS